MILIVPVADGARGHRSAMFQPGPVVAQAYKPPSPEVRRLLRRVGWLTSPAPGLPSLAARIGLQAVISPMTQLTFFSFDLQAFLFVVFHRSRVAVIGHGVFMTTENLFLMALLRQITVAHTPLGTVDGGLLFALVLLGWYGRIAWQARLRAWFALTAPFVVILYLASGPVGAACRETLHVSPAWGVLASALLVAFSHLGEPLLPPRTADRWRWVPLRDYLLAPDLRFRTRALRLGHLTVVTVIGIVGEAWASPRLMPYNWLLLMMRLGYAGERYAEISGWAERAWATGNPALDFVGTGGGTFLAAEPEPEPGATPITGAAANMQPPARSCRATPKMRSRPKLPGSSSQPGKRRKLCRATPR